MKVRDLLKALAEDGWVIKNQEGSYRQLVHPAKPGKSLLPASPAPMLLGERPNLFLKQAGITL